MKKLLVGVLVLSTLFVACKSAKNVATPATVDPTKLDGTWELNYIAGSRIAFEGLYPDKKPTITLQVADEKINGSTGCNSFIGIFKVNGNVIDFTSPLALTKMACPGTGETVFLNTLKAVNSYNIDGKKLSFMSSGTETMRLEKK